MSRRKGGDICRRDGDRTLNDDARMYTVEPNPSRQGHIAITNFLLPAFDAARMSGGDGECLSGRHVVQYENLNTSAMAGNKPRRGL